MSEQVAIDNAVSLLPLGWTGTTLSALGKWTSGGTPSRSRADYYSGHVPWVKTGDLPDGPVYEIPESITPAGLENSSAKTFPAGTLLIAMYGATIGKLGVLVSPAATNQACAALLPSTANRGILPYTFYYLLSQRTAFRNAGKGGAQPNISQTLLKHRSARKTNNSDRLPIGIDAETQA